MHAHLHSVLGLLVTCMYTDLSEPEANQAAMSEDKMELVSILFDRLVMYLYVCLWYVFMKLWSA